MNLPSPARASLPSQAGVAGWSAGPARLPRPVNGPHADGEYARTQYAECPVPDKTALLLDHPLAKASAPGAPSNPHSRRNV